MHAHHIYLNPNDPFNIDPPSTLNKKAKQQTKRETLLKKLDSSYSPYSKSHHRRLKRKAKEEIAGGLGAIQEAISAVENEVADPRHPRDMPNSTEKSESQSIPIPKAEANTSLMIGEGKSTPLTKSQRQRALQLERLRHPLILSNPEFSANPFQTIRTHASNTLLKREV